jgi:peptide/nickel transport system ATP-binding protein
VIRALQYAFQNPYTSLNPRKTVGRLVEQPLRQLFKLPASERECRVVAALRDAALNVTSALDVSVQAAIVELLHRFELERRLTLVLITHNLALVRSLADDVVILRDGRVVEHGPEVLDTPRSEYALQLLSDVPTIERAQQSQPHPATSTVRP